MLRKLASGRERRNAKRHSNGKKCSVPKFRCILQFFYLRESGTDGGTWCSNLRVLFRFSRSQKSRSSCWPFLIFHQSEDQFFSHNNQNRIDNTQQQVNSKSGMEPSVIIITHKFSGVLRCYFRYQIDLQLQSRRTTRQEEKPVWRETWPKLFGKFPLS